MKYFIVDAFAERNFSGNPAGVCLLDAPMSDGVMQSIAAENNLAETAFLLKQDNDYRLRWFTPEQEFDLCGHATLASAFVLFRYVEPQADILKFATQSGALTVRRKGEQLEMDFPSRPAEPIPVLPCMEAAIGKKVAEAYLSRDMMLILDTEDDVKTMNPDLDLVSAIPDCINLIVTAPGSSVDFVSRYFTPNISIPEDPVTGSAHCTLAPYWSKRLGKHALKARQLSQRGGTLYCEDDGERVKISGTAVLYLSGELHLSHSS